LFLETKVEENGKESVDGERGPSVVLFFLVWMRFCFDDVDVDGDNWRE
jgi:hypothetical protein